MKFRTEIHLDTRYPQIQYSDDLLGMGSCFAERIGQRLQAGKFKALVNPLGIVYNPVSLCRQIKAILGEHPLSEPLLHDSLGFWHSFDVHSSFNQTNRELLEARLEKALAQARTKLSSASVLILTFGTAWVYKRKDTGVIVANCHKYPSGFFSRDLLAVNAMMEVMFDLIRSLKAFNPALNLLLTVSPVRHIKDGLEKNSVSKASLRLLCHQLRQSFSNVHYFPAYEILIDDLRDYRFYENDLIHPSGFAEDYIWELFIRSHLTPESQELLHRWQQIQKEIAHRPLRPDAVQYRQFLEKLLIKLRGIHLQLPCDEEILLVQERLNAL